MPIKCSKKLANYLPVIRRANDLCDPTSGVIVMGCVRENAEIKVDSRMRLTAAAVCFQAAKRNFSNDWAVLRAALSCYYSGNFLRGFNRIALVRRYGRGKSYFPWPSYPAAALEISRRRD
jgi:hypothetical protein